MWKSLQESIADIYGWLSRAREEAKICTFSAFRTRYTYSKFFSYAKYRYVIQDKYAEVISLGLQVRFIILCAWASTISFVMEVSKESTIIKGSLGGCRMFIYLASVFCVSIWLRQRVQWLNIGSTEWTVFLSLFIFLISSFLLPFFLRLCKGFLWPTLLGSWEFISG